MGGRYPARMTEWHGISRDGIRLECKEYGGGGEGGDGPAVLFLHGLAGYAGEWDETASWLPPAYRAFALDQRGHGRSERRPADVSRAAYVADAVAVVEELGLAPVVLVGQSMGGLAALLCAAQRPDLVRALVVVEASPGGIDRDGLRNVGNSLKSWPVPFPDREAALAHFGGDTGAGRAWADGLEAGPDGLRPRFEVDVMIATLEATLDLTYWDEWSAIRCPTLIVTAGRGVVSADKARTMVERLPGSRLTGIADAGHDVHLDAPQDWREALTGFLNSL
jgi:pimeloyl-ACP methyl ester carboxylesterase